MQDIGRKLLQSIGYAAPSDADIALAIEANDIFVAELERIRDAAQGIIIDQWSHIASLLMAFMAPQLMLPGLGADVAAALSWLGVDTVKFSIVDSLIWLCVKCLILLLLLSLTV
jgi:hypothetical protein